MSRTLNISEVSTGGIPTRRPPLFDLGRLSATPGALDALEEAPFAGASSLLTRHRRGDWGDLSDDDKAANDDALVVGDRLLSAYVLPTGCKLWILTEGDRSRTTILLSEEY